jgi:cell division protein ZapA
MNGDSKTIDIALMGKQFRVACQPGEEKLLLASVDYLDKKMREIRDSGKIVGSERIALMAALNISHELMAARAGTGFDTAEFKRRIEAMEASLEQGLAEQENLF